MKPKKTLKHISREKLIAIKEKTEDARFIRNIEIILLGYEEFSATGIAKKLNLPLSTVCFWIDKWNEQGLDGLVWTIRPPFAHIWGLKAYL